MTEPSVVAPSDLIERLGYTPTTRAIIINADDFGMCHAANTAITELLSEGALDATTLMVPCPWAPEALAFSAANTHLDVGVHLVLTSEWSRYRWRPLTGTGTTLVDADGYFPSEVIDVERAASDDDVAAELQAQLTAALAAGVDVTHLDNHMGSVYGLHTGRHFMGQALQLSAQHGLPFRMPRSVLGSGLDPAVQAVATEAARVADERGVVILDYLWTHPFELIGEGTGEEETYEQVREGFTKLLRAVPAGVTEIYLHPMDDTDELRQTVDFAAKKRGFETRLLRDPQVLRVIDEENLVRIGWRALRTVQRGDETMR